MSKGAPVTLGARVDRFIFSEYRTDSSSLGIYRILYALYVLTVYLPEHLWVPKFPDSFYNPPPGLTDLFFTGFPSEMFFIVLNAAEIIAASALLFGYRTRISSVFLAGMLLVGNSWAYSFGKIDHDILLILAPLLMQAAGWGGAYSLDRAAGRAPRRTRAWPMAMFALLIALAMMTAAEAKATSGWLRPGAHAALAHMLRDSFVAGHSGWITGRMLAIPSGWFWKSLDYGTVLLEASFVATVVRRGAFRIVCALACFFHLGIALSMQIPFAANLLAYAAFFDWSAVQSRLAELYPGAATLLRRGSLNSTRAAGLVPLSLGAALAALYLTSGNPFRALLQYAPSGWHPRGLPLYATAAAIAALFLASRIRRAVFPAPVSIRQASAGSSSLPPAPQART